MNCSSLRNRILALPDPSAVSDPVSAHLKGCPACQSWHRLLLQVESVVALVAVPASDEKRKRELVAQFRSAPKAAERPKSDERPLDFMTNKPTKKSASPVKPMTPRQPLGERLAKMWPMGLVAAALLIGAVVWSTFRGKNAPEAMMAKAPNDPMLKEVVAAKVELDKAHTGVDRVKVLAKLADTIHEEARTLSRITPEEMTSLAAMYKQVVEEALVPQARSLNEIERKNALPRYAQRLGEAEQEANRLAAESPSGSDRALRDIAESARAGRIQLARLIQGRAT